MTWRQALAMLVMSLLLADLPSAEDLVPGFGLESFPQPLPGSDAPDEQQLDRRTAQTLFAHGRLLELNNDRAGALRRYQRAWRYDPQAKALLSEIVELASSLERYGEAARYATRAPDDAPQDTALLARLGLYLLQRDQAERGLPLLERALALRGDQADATTMSLRAELGRFYYSEGQFDQAARHFDAVDEVLSGNRPDGLSQAARELLERRTRSLYPQMAEAFLRAGKVREAKSIFEKAQRAAPDAALASYHRARLAVAERDTRRAQADLERYFAAKTDAAGAAPYALFADIITARGSDKEAAGESLLRSLAELHRRDPHNAELKRFYAARLYEADNLGQAGALYDELLREAARDDVLQNRCRIAQLQQDWESLLVVLTTAASMDSGLNRLGSSLEVLATDGPTIRQLVEAVRARVSAPDSLPSRETPFAIVLLAIAARDYATVDELVPLALATSERPSNELCESLALELMLRDQFTRAADLFQSAVTHAERSGTSTASYYFHLSGALELSGRTDAALDAAQQAAQLRPTSPRFQERIAWVLYHGKRYQEAERRYTHFLKQYDHRFDSDAIRGLMRDARLVLSSICLARHRPTEAEEWLEQILDEFPEDSSARNDLGYLWVDQGRHLQRGQVMIEAAVNSDPGNPAYRDSLGWAYYRLGRFAEAVRELETASQDRPEDGQILDHLGDAYWHSERSSEAIAAWRRAAELFSRQGDRDAADAVRAKLDRHVID